MFGRRFHVACAVVVTAVFVHATAFAATPGIAFVGAGWGHGVGLSQYGAKAMASDGATYLQILQRYYSGISVNQPQVSGPDSFLFSDPTPLWVGLLQDQPAVSFSVPTGAARLCFDLTGACLTSGDPGTSWRFAPDGLGGCRFEQVLTDGSRSPVGISGACNASIRPDGTQSTVSVPFKARLYQRGILRLREVGATDRMHLSLEIGVEDYLYGLSEVPDLWPTAAVEAQVVASRSLAVRQVLAVGPESGFDAARLDDCHCHLLDRSPDPNYRGLAGEIAHPAWATAVVATIHQVVSHQGSVAMALYSSSSGGSTESYVDVFAGTDHPYLATVFDSPSLSDPANNPHRSWGAGFAQATIADAFGFSWVSDIAVTERNDSGSARTVTLTGIRSGRPATSLVNAVEMRLALSLRSTTFDISVVSPFDDVSTDHVFAGEIVGLNALRITSGCTMADFCPDRPVTRGEMAAFLVRALSLPSVTGDPFTDDDGHTLEAEIASLAASGITSGCSAASFCPNRPVTRGEMAAFLTRGFDLVAGAGLAFGDVEGHFFQAEIASLAASGITSGCSAASFCPNRPVTRGEMAAFLIRALD
jgi:SpoIID/LytB domain protein